TYLVITRPSSYRSTLHVNSWRVPVTTSGASSLSFGGAAPATPTHTTRTSPSNTRRVERIAVPPNEPTVPFPTYLSSETTRKVTNLSAPPAGHVPHATCLPRRTLRLSCRGRLQAR